MPNHLHLLAFTSNPEKTIDKIIGTGKRIMAYEIVERLKKIARNDLLALLSDAVVPSERSRNKKHEVFEDSFDCKEIVTEKFVRQKLNYMDKNPVSGKWKLVEHSLAYDHSSARFYDLEEKAKCRLFHYAEIVSVSGSLQQINKGFKAATSRRFSEDKKSLFLCSHICL